MEGNVSKENEVVCFGVKGSGGCNTKSGNYYIVKKERQPFRTVTAFSSDITVKLETLSSDDFRLVAFNGLPRFVSWPSGMSLGSKFR